MSVSTVYCGIDVAKKTLDAFLLGEHFHQPNTPQGWLALIAWVTARAPKASIACEATGGYERAMVRAFQLAGFATQVVPPARVREFARSMGYLAKTDRIDASVIAHFAETRKAPISQFVPSPVQEHLTALIDFQQQVRLKIVDLTNQIQMLLDPLTKASATRLLKAHQKEIAHLDKACAKLLQQDPQLQTKLNNLTAFQGVGKITALALLAHLPELGTVSDAKITALVGLAPYNNDSGPKKGKRSIRGGRGHVRKSLYMAALTAARINPVLSVIYKRLRANGKPPKVAITALMRKLLTALNAAFSKPNFHLITA